MPSRQDPADPIEEKLATEPRTGISPAFLGVRLNGQARRAERVHLLTRHTRKWLVGALKPR
jgi:hypothetical protein